MKKKSIVRRLLPWVILAALLALLIKFVIIPLYAPQEEEVLAQPEVYYFEGEAETLTLENEYLLFEMDTETTHFELTDKTTGKVWLSNPAKADKDKVAGTTQKGNLQSTLILHYSPKNAVDAPFNNFQYSINKGLYKIEKVDEEVIRVTYTITDMERIYQIPYAMTAERYQQYRSAMSGKDRKKFEGFYTKQDAKKFKDKSEKDQATLKAQYPTIGEVDIYTAKASSWSRGQFEQCEALMASYGYNEEEFLIDQANVAAQDVANKLLFNVTMEYRLDGEDFVVSVPFEDMRYRSDNVITYVTVLPMFGAAGTDQEGFMFVPEGGGAIINYNNGKLRQNAYYADLYGWDYATKRTEVVNETQCTFPVFGMGNSDGSFICMLEGASAYAGIQADISMREHSYNYVNAKHRVLHSDAYNVSAKTAEIVKMFEKELPDNTIVQRYRFVEGGSYVDMANAYGSYLAQMYPKLFEETVSGDMPVSVELVGAISKTVVKLGAPVDSALAVTDFEDAEKILSDLSGIENLSVRYSGWMNKGVNQRVMNNIKIQKELGGEKSMKNLIAYAKENNIPLYFDGISCFAYDSGMFQGFTAFSDAARFTTREQVKIEPYSYVTYLPVDWKDAFYLVKPDYAYEMSANLIAKLDETDAYGVAFRDIGSLLSADYNPKDTVTREEVKALNIETLENARSAGKSVMLKEGFDFTLPYADVITDMDLVGTRYAILDGNIPFYQIALHGYLDYTGEAINIASDWETELLNCAEYGAGLNFTFMAEKGTIVQETYHSGLYGASYIDWAEDAKEMIGQYQTAMAGLNSERIVNHEILTQDVRVTTYENGKKVYVNYGTDEFTDGTVTVPARSYIVTGGEM